MITRITAKLIPPPSYQPTLTPCIQHLLKLSNEPTVDTLQQLRGVIATVTLTVDLQTAIRKKEKGVHVLKHFLNPTIVKSPLQKWTYLSSHPHN